MLVGSKPINAHQSLHFVELYNNTEAVITLKEDDKDYYYN